MASVPHQQDSSTVTQHESAIDTMTSTSFATSLLQAGKLTPADHETLVALINHDISSAAHKDALTLSVSGHIGIRLSVSCRQVEAVAAVFNTAELLEAILIHLPATSLVLDVPLVCKGFHEAVQSSQKLQRRMYRSLYEWPNHKPDVFAAGVAGFEFDTGDYGYYNDDIKLYIRPWKMKHHASYDGLRARQLSHPVIKSADLYLVIEEAATGKEPEHKSCVFDDWMRSDKGITFGDILDVVEQDQRRMVEYEFLLSTDLLDGGRL